LDGHTAYCNAFLLLQSAFENNVTIIRLPIHRTHTLQNLYTFFLGPLKRYLKNEAAACKITRYRMTRLIGFAWSKVAGDAVSAFESTGIYHLKRNGVPEYLFSIFDTS